MKESKFLQEFSGIADIHAQRLSAALNEINALRPLGRLDLATLGDKDIAFLDLMTTRFCKLQDVIGSKIFPLLLKILAEECPAFIDKLNRLEKLGYLAKAQWWLELRETRNALTHEYSQKLVEVAQNLDHIADQAKDLLSFWYSFKASLPN